MGTIQIQNILLFLTLTAAVFIGLQQNSINKAQFDVNNEPSLNIELTKNLDDQDSIKITNLGKSPIIITEVVIDNKPEKTGSTNIEAPIGIPIYYPVTSKFFDYLRNTINKNTKQTLIPLNVKFRVPSLKKNFISNGLFILEQDDQITSSVQVVVLSTKLSN